MGGKNIRTEYAVEVYNKLNDRFLEQIEVFETNEEAKQRIKESDYDIDKDSEYLRITEIEYDDEDNEIGTMRM